MPQQNINIQSNKFALTDAIKTYILSKLSRHANKFKGTKNIILHIAKQSNKTKDKYQLTVEVKFQQFSFIIKENGDNVYRMIDRLAKRIHLKISKLHEMNSLHPNINYGYN